MERELAATEKQQTDLREKIKRLEGEKEDWKVCCVYPGRGGMEADSQNKHIALQKMHSSSTGAMQVSSILQMIANRS